jgi:catechol 2,3-dioxygenase-like lactoylglutathione lyase family enzyme
MVFVPDLEAARTFYGGILGLAVDREGRDHLGFRYGGGTLIAFRCDRGTAVGDYSREARAVFVFAVTSVEQTSLDLKEKGVRVLHDVPADGPLGAYAAFVDPFGIVHEVHEVAGPTRQGDFVVAHHAAACADNSDTISPRTGPRRVVRT